MSRSIEEQNKATVLKAFDTLFNKRDYAAAEKFWSPDYISTKRPYRTGARRSIQSGEGKPTDDKV